MARTSGPDLCYLKSGHFAISGVLWFYSPIGSPRRREQIGGRRGDGDSPVFQVSPGHAGKRSARGWRIPCLLCMRPTNPGNIAVAAYVQSPLLASQSRHSS